MSIASVKLGQEESFGEYIITMEVLEMDDNLRSDGWISDGKYGNYSFGLRSIIEPELSLDNLHEDGDEGFCTIYLRGSNERNDHIIVSSSTDDPDLYLLLVRFLLDNDIVVFDSSPGKKEAKHDTFWS